MFHPKILYLTWNKGLEGKLQKNKLADLIEHAIEETWDHWKDCWLQSFQIIHQKSNVPLKVADSSPLG